MFHYRLVNAVVRNRNIVMVNQVLIDCLHLLSVANSRYQPVRSVFGSAIHGIGEQGVKHSESLGFIVFNPVPSVWVAFVRFVGRRDQLTRHPEIIVTSVVIFVLKQVFRPPLSITMF